MRQFFLLSQFLFFAVIVLSSQTTLSGIVIDGSTKEALPFATVYFDGTTNGQTTDENGRFSLSTMDIELPTVLVVSHVGYTTQTLNIEKITEELKIVLKIRGQIMNTVVVKDQNQRQKNLEEFRSVFLGVDAWGKNAHISNEEDILFDRDYARKKVKTTSVHMKKIALQTRRKDLQWASDSSYFVYNNALNLKASSNAPLTIELPDLGYKLQFDLLSFHAEYEQGKTGHLAHYYFIPAEGTNGKIRPRHLKNRQRAYFNSSLHFLRSLFVGKLSENGYQLYEQSNDKAKSKKNLKPFDMTPFLHRINDEKMDIRNLKGRNFAVLFYGDQKGRPLPQNKWKRVQPVQSGLHFGENVCSIRVDGTIGDSNLLFSGYIGSRGVAWVLPSDYSPTE